MSDGSDNPSNVVLLKSRKAGTAAETPKPELWVRWASPPRADTTNTMGAASVNFQKKVSVAAETSEPEIRVHWSVPPGVRGTDTMVRSWERYRKRDLDGVAADQVEIARWAFFRGALSLAQAVNDGKDVEELARETWAWACAQP
jgi:hypothetical protein